MKKTLRLVAVFALMGATLAYTGCTDYSKDFDDINNRIEALESGKLKSVEEQVAGLKSTVASLEDAKSKAEAAIAELQKNSATAADLKALEAKLDAAVKDAASKAAVEDLKSKLEKIEADLAKYAKVETLNAEVEKLNKAIADAKALTEKEFATVNDKIKAITDWQVEAVAKLGALEGQIKTLEEGLATSQQDIITLTEGLKSVSAATGILEDEVEKIYDELNIAWDRIRELTEGLRSTTAGLAIAEQDIIALQTDMTDVKEALKALKEASAKHVTADYVKEAVKTAVAEAIANDGVISAEIAKAVKAATDKLQAQIDAIKNVVKNLTEQIQSIVYVPENVNGKMKSYKFSLGDTFKTPIMVRATYEVTPWELASSITSDNVFASTVALKAAPAEYFDVNVLSTDPKTGRVEVCINITENTEAYKTLANNGNIAIALNIVDNKISNIPGEDEIFDAGCKKSSSYVTVLYPQMWINLASALKITKDGEVTDSPAGENIPVYYDEPNSEKALFKGYDIAMKIFDNDELMTIEEAAEFFGTNLKLNFKEEISYDQNGVAKKESETPIKVDGVNLNKTAKISPLDKVSGKDMVGYRATVSFNTFTLNGVAVSGMTFKSTYKITNTVSTIVYPEQKIIDWKYSYETTAPVFYTEINEEVIGKGTAPSIATLERYELVDGEWSPTLCNNSEKAEPNASTQAGEYQVTGKIKFSNLQFTPGKKVKYVAKYKISNTSENKEYDVECTVYLDGMPANSTIDLGTVEAVRNFTSDYTNVSLKPIAETYKSYSADYPELTSANAFIEAFVANQNRGAIKVTENDAPAAATTGYSFTFASTKKDGKVTGEKATLIIPKASVVNNTIVVEQPVTVFGVTYTYKVKFVFSNPNTYVLKTNATRVDENNVAPLYGTYKFGKDGERTNYALDKIELSDYLYVDGHKGSTEALKVKFQEVTIKSGKEALSDPITYLTVTDGELSSYTYTGFTPTTKQVKLRATLIMTNNLGKDGKPAEIGTVDITLKPKDVIKSIGVKEAKADVESGKEKSVNLFNYLSVVDLKGQELVYKDAKIMTEMWDMYDTKNKAQIANYYKVYAQNVVFEKESDIIIKHNGVVIDPSRVNYKYVPGTGVLTLNANNADLIGTLTFEIEATLTYIYGGERTETVVVEFTQKK